MMREKTTEEIALLAEGGKRLFRVLEELEHMAKPGMTGKQLDAKAINLIAKFDAKPAFLGYHDFPGAVCVSTNNAVVHGIPDDTPFAEGDLVGIDAGLIYKGLYTDSARTVAIGQISPEQKRLMNITKSALEAGIARAVVGNTTGDIGEAVQELANIEGFGIVRQLVGHGVGYAVHEEPQVPNFGKAGSGTQLTPGLVIAIEPMFTLGSPAVKTDKDGWTIITEDGSMAAHFEHTVAVTADGPKILTIA